MDIHLAAHALEKGQVLIVSVFGSGDSFEEMSRGFINAALLAKNSGAHLIEANFSCPNVSSGGALYSDPEASYSLAKKIADTIKPTPLIVKMGIFKNPAKLEPVLLSLAKAGVRSVCGINTIPMKVIDQKGGAALGENRLQSGICGDPIRPLALSFIQQCRTIIDNHKLDLEIMGCGGMTQENHFDQFLNAGAKAALTATGMMWDPYLAYRWHLQGREL